ncbi:hypothetical protein Tco_0408554 [Tanacetum coccineum]
MDTGIGTLNMELNWENVATIKVNASVPTSLDNLGGKPNVECACLVDNPYVASPPTVIASTLEPVSFATLLKDDPSQKSINFHPLLAPAGNGTDVAISKESVCVVNKRLGNTVYGFFLGKHVAYSVVENYFSSNDEMEAMIENGLWLIRNVSLILKNRHRMSSYARAMVELRADVELKDTIVSIKDSMDRKVREAQQGRDEKKRLDHLKQDQEMLVIKIFSERKKVFRERKKCEKIRAKRSDFQQGIEQYL